MLGIPEGWALVPEEMFLPHVSRFGPTVGCVCGLRSEYRRSGLGDLYHTLNVLAVEGRGTNGSAQIRFLQEKPHQLEEMG